jgi:hypothetical protein
MRWLIALLAAIGAVAAGVFFRLRNRKSRGLFDRAKDSTSSWSKAAADKAGAAGDKVGAAAKKVAGAAP